MAHNIFHDPYDHIPNSFLYYALTSQHGNCRGLPALYHAARADAITRIPFLLEERLIRGPDFRACNKVFCAAWLDDHTVITGSKCNSMMLVDTLSGATRHITLPTLPTWARDPAERYDRACGIHAISLNPGRTLLASSGACPNDGLILDLPTLRPVQHLRGHKDWIFCNSWLSGRQVATGSRDCTIRLWNVERGKDDPLGRVDTEPVAWCTKRDRVRQMRFSDRRKLLLSISPLGVTHVWTDELRHLHSYNLLSSFADQWSLGDPPPVCLAVNDAGTFAAAAADIFGLLDTRTRVMNLHFLPGEIYKGLRSLSFNGDHLLSMGGVGGCIAFLDLRTGKLLEHHVAAVKHVPVAPSPEGSEAPELDDDEYDDDDDGDAELMSDVVGSGDEGGFSQRPSLPSTRSVDVGSPSPPPGLEYEPVSDDEGEGESGSGEPDEDGGEDEPAAKRRHLEDLAASLHGGASGNGRPHLHAGGGTTSSGGGAAPASGPSVLGPTSRNGPHHHDSASNRGAMPLHNGRSPVVRVDSKALVRGRSPTADARWRDSGWPAPGWSFLASWDPEIPLVPAPHAGVRNDLAPLSAVAGPGGRGRALAPGQYYTITRGFDAAGAATVRLAAPHAGVRSDLVPPAAAAPHARVHSDLIPPAAAAARPATGLGLTGASGSAFTAGHAAPPGAASGPPPGLGRGAPDRPPGIGFGAPGPSHNAGRGAPGPESSIGCGAPGPPPSFGRGIAGLLLRGASGPSHGSGHGGLGSSPGGDGVGSSRGGGRGGALGSSPGMSPGMPPGLSRGAPGPSPGSGPGAPGPVCGGERSAAQSSPHSGVRGAPSVSPPGGGRGNLSTAPGGGVPNPSFGDARGASGSSLYDDGGGATAPSHSAGGPSSGLGSPAARGRGGGAHSQPSPSPGGGSQPGLSLYPGGDSPSVVSHGSPSAPHVLRSPAARGGGSPSARGRGGPLPPGQSPHRGLDSPSVAGRSGGSHPGLPAHHTAGEAAATTGSPPSAEEEGSEGETREPVVGVPYMLGCDNGWSEPDSYYRRAFGNKPVEHVVYTHVWDATGTQLFVGGGPLTVGVPGCYMAVWH